MASKKKTGILSEIGKKAKRKKNLEKGLCRRCQKHKGGRRARGEGKLESGKKYGREGEPGDDQETSDDFIE